MKPFVGYFSPLHFPWLAWTSDPEASLHAQTNRTESGSIFFSSLPFSIELLFSFPRAGFEMMRAEFWPLRTQKRPNSHEKGEKGESNPISAFIALQCPFVLIMLIPMFLLPPATSLFNQTSRRTTTAMILHLQTTAGVRSNLSAILKSKYDKMK